MMMTIDNEILIKFVTGNCSEDELLQVKDWMEQSKDNADQVLAFERIYREAQATTMSKGQIEKALEHVHNRIALDECNATRKRNVVVLRRWSIAAATIALNYCGHRSVDLERNAKIKKACRAKCCRIKNKR